MSFNDVYQSIVGAGGTPGKANAGTPGSIAGSFHPGQFAGVNKQIASNHLKTVPVAGDRNNLSSALQNLHNFKPDDQVRIINRSSKAGIINPSHASSLVTGILKNNAPAPIPLSGLQKPLAAAGSFTGNVPGAARTLGNAITAAGNSVVKPIERIPANATLITSNAVSKAIGKGPITAKQIANTPNSPIRVGVKAGAKGSVKQLAGDVAQTASLAVGGSELAGAKGLLATSAKLGAAGAVGGAGATVGNNPKTSGKDIIKAGVEGAVAGAALPFAGAAIRGVKQTLLDGPKALLEKSKVNTLVGAGREANKPTKISVNDASARQSVDVKTPTKINVQGKTTADKINVRSPQAMTEQQFNSEFSKLHTGYDRETKQLQGIAAGMPGKQLQAAQQSLENKYQGKLNDLVDTYHTPPLSDPVAPKRLRVPKEKATVRTLPISTSVEKTAKPVKQTVSETTPKTAPETMSAPKAPAVESNFKTAPNVPGALKTAGSSTKLNKEFVEKGLVQRTEGLPEFEGINKKDQAAKATDLVNNNRQEAIDIIQGMKSAPDGLHPVAIHNALVAAVRKEGDGDLADIVAKAHTNRELSEHGQGLSLAAERDPHDPVEAIRQISAIRKKTIEATTKVTQTKAQGEELKAIRAAKATVKGPSKQDWHSFVESLKC